MRYILLIVGSLILLTFFCACTKSYNSQIEIISVDVDKAQSLDMNEGRFIELETTDSSLLYEISNIGFLNGKIIILSRETVCVFDRNGKFLFNAGRKGPGPGEYINLANIFVKGNSVYLLDQMSKKLLCFDGSGNFVSSIKLNITNTGYPVTDLFPLENGNYVAKNMFHGDQEKVPIASIWDKDFNFVRNIAGRLVTTGLTSHDNFSQYKDQILYWETLNDTVFVINNYNSMTAKYYIDFGKSAIPAYERAGKDVYDVIDYLNKQPENAKIAGQIRNVFENEEQLLFRFGFQSRTLYALYDKENKNTQVFHFEDKNNQYNVNGLCWYYQDSLYLTVIPETDSFQNPFLVVFDKRVLQKNNHRQ
jgi:hypothetical protein